MKKAKNKRKGKNTMRKIISIILLLTLTLSSFSLVSCQDKLQEQWNSKLESTYILETPLSRFFLNNRFKKTLNSYIYVYIYGENDSLDVDFFGKWQVKSIESVSYVTRYRKDSNASDESVRCTEYLLKLYQNNKINLLCVAYRLSKLPEVFNVDAFVEGDILC